MTRPRVAVARWQDVPLERLHRYWEALERAGIEAVDYCESGQSLEDCAGLVLCGGIDVDPARYGEERDPSVDEINPDRDAHESGALTLALAADLSVLAICRGHQLLNVHLGGSLLQDIPGGHHRSLEEEGYPSAFHDVVVEETTLLGEILGAGSTMVNSRHHQGVTTGRLAPGLRISAVSDDGLIEGVESEAHHWVIGVQWHPEREESHPSFDAGSARLFAAFREAMTRAD